MFGVGFLWPKNWQHLGERVDNYDIPPYFLNTVFSTVNIQNVVSDIAKTFRRHFFHRNIQIVVSDIAKTVRRQRYLRSVLLKRAAREQPRLPTSGMLLERSAPLFQKFMLLLEQLFNCCPFQDVPFHCD